MKKRYQVLVHMVCLLVPFWGSGYTLIWEERFDDLSIGAVVDNGDTAWSLNNTNGKLRVVSGALQGNNLDATFTWTSESVDISSGRARFTVDLNSAKTSNLESPDFLRVSYRLDGGELVTAAEYIDKTTPIGDEWITFEESDLFGSTIEVVIQLSNSSNNETYKIDNVGIFTRQNALPEVVMVSPLDGSYITQGLTVDLSANASDDSAVTQVEFFVGGISVGVDTDSSDGWTSSFIADTVGTLDITAIATDDESATKSSELVNLTVSATNVPPVVNITEPTDAFSVITGTMVSVAAAASDDHGVSDVEFFVDGESIGVDTNRNDGWSVDWTPAVAGNYALSALATDILGGETISSAVNVAVEDIVLSPPVASFTASAVEGKSPVLITFDGSGSSDPGGNNAGIEIYYWDFDGDGNADFTSASSVSEFEYTQSGRYDVVLTVEDKDGQTAQYTIPIEIEVGVRVAYAAPGADSEFAGVLELSDGTILIGGGAANLDWLPSGTPVTPLANPSDMLSSSASRVAFLLHCSSDLDTILRAYALPVGAAGNIQRIRSTNIPGEATGDIYVSGLTNSGHFIGRLNGNIIDAPITGLDWAIPLSVKSEHSEAQAWDVGSDGVLVFQYDSGGNTIIGFRDAAGQRTVLPDLRASHLVSGVETRGVGVDLPGASSSFIELPVDMQSWTEEERTLIQPDGNGSLKMGTWPWDIFITSKRDGSGDPVRLVLHASGDWEAYGYTGYRWGGETWVRSIAVDRRNNDFYIGMNANSRFHDPNLKNGAGAAQPDFEPAVIAYNSRGGLKWWSRLYHEWIDRDEDGQFEWTEDTPWWEADETNLSMPDQYCDAIEIDYSADYGSGSSLVVHGRQHGSGPTVLWPGNSIASRPWANGFQNRPTGTEGNVHLSWLGKLDLTDGTLRAATYLAGFFRFDGGNYPDATYGDPNLGTAANHNSGWPQLTTTQITRNTVRVDEAGRVYVIGRGPRMVTTREAWQPIPNRTASNNEGNAPWHQYVRVYASDLSTLNYGTALTGEWDYPDGDIFQNPINADNTKLLGILPTQDGLIVTGYHQEKNSVTKGNPVPVNDIPEWATDTPVTQTALFGRFELTDPSNWDRYDQNFRDHALVGDARGTFGTHAGIETGARSDVAENFFRFAFRKLPPESQASLRKIPKLSSFMVGNGRKTRFEVMRAEGGSGDLLGSEGYSVDGVTRRLLVSDDLINWEPAGNHLTMTVSPNSDEEEGVEMITLETLDPDVPYLFIREELSID